MRHGILILSAVCVAAVVCVPAQCLAAPGPVVSTAALATPKIQEDFPAMCVDRKGTPWVAYVQWDGKVDVLKLARKTKAGLKAVATLAGPGIIHQPAIACDAKGAIWVVWSQVADDNVMKLHARRVVDGKPDAGTVAVSAQGSAVFSDAGADAKGRVWVVWQSFRGALGDIYARYYDPAAGKWSAEIRVTTDAGGDWEPRLAFAKDAAYIAFDSSRGGDEFNVYLARVSGEGKVKLVQLTKSPRYEGRASIAATPDGKGLWIAWESGRLLWGKNTRGVGGQTGLNWNKGIGVVHYEVATGRVTAAADVTRVVKTAGAAAPKPAPKKPAPKKPPPKGAKKPPPKKPRRRPRRPGAAPTVNLPEIVVDAEGNPWLAGRFFRGTHWKIALTRYDTSAKAWSRAVVLPDSSFGQDRRCRWARDEGGGLWLAWPSDRRTSKRALHSGVYLAKIDAGASVPAAPKLAGARRAGAAKPPARWGDDTPDRPRADRHSWEAGGKKYGLYWGDFHRHTDVSNCRTADDGCIVEQFRYAYDIGKLDLLGTSDHTDAGKPYYPYEWWCNQKLADVFYTPGFFNSMYVYEREQRWPWGHRNVIFSERGGPIIYIKRALHKSMPWQATLPAGAGGAEIMPPELWKLLRKSGMNLTIISHTGATGMGTDWDGYKRIDTVENVVEIYQGARVSYEGVGTPQPTVGFVRGAKPKAGARGPVKTGKDFGRYNKGVYQNALKNGWKLGVFANSDHISTHTTFGGVYAESFTRKGIVDAINARRTIAATDKIFIEFSCNGRLLGEIFETSDKPTLKVSVLGTAPLRAVTIVRNEKDLKRFAPKGKTKFGATFTDDEPIAGENRYYIRVEQTDGNMGWASPVWVTYKKK